MMDSPRVRRLIGADLLAEGQRMERNDRQNQGVVYLLDPSNFMGTNMNQNPVFWAAFWAGLASPVSLYSAPASYVPYINGYSVASSFAQVGVSLTQSSLSAFDGRQPDDPEDFAGHPCA